MSNEMRSAVVSYCNLGVGNELAGKMNLHSPLHPRLKKVYNYLKKQFVEVIIVDHDLLSTETHRERFLQYLPTADLRDGVRNQWSKQKYSGEELYRIFVEEYEEWKAKQKSIGERKGAKA